MNEHGHVPIELYLQKWMASSVWPVGHSVLTPGESEGSGTWE